MATYYFDGSDAAATDPNGVWTNDSNAFDGDTATVAEAITNGDTVSNFLKAEGTNAPSSGGVIAEVKARLYSTDAGAALSANVYTDGLAQDLGVFSDLGVGWGGYVTLATPTGGWTWAKVQALEVKIYRDGGISSAKVSRVELSVITLSETYPGSIYKLQGFQ